MCQIIRGKVGKCGAFIPGRTTIASSNIQFISDAIPGPIVTVDQLLLRKGHKTISRDLVFPRPRTPITFRQKTGRVVDSKRRFIGGDRGVRPTGTTGTLVFHGSHSVNGGRGPPVPCFRVRRFFLNDFLRFKYTHRFTTT